MNIFEKQFHVLNLCFHMLNISFKILVYYLIETLMNIFEK